MWVFGTSYVTVRLTLSPTTHKSACAISLQKWSPKHQVVSRAAGGMKPQQVEVPNFETLIQVLKSFHWLQDVSECQSMSHCRRPRLLVGYKSGLGTSWATSTQTVCGMCNDKRVGQSFLSIGCLLQSTNYCWFIAWMEEKENQWIWVFVCHFYFVISSNGDFASKITYTPLVMSITLLIQA